MDRVLGESLDYGLLEIAGRNFGPGSGGAAQLTATPSNSGRLADNGDTLELTITGTPTALYYNGVEVSGAIYDGKYTVANVDKNHLRLTGNTGKRIDKMLFSVDELDAEVVLDASEV